MSRIIARFSSSVVRSASSTCRSWHLATRVTTGAPGVHAARATSGSSAAVDAGPAGRAERRQRRVLEVELVLRAPEELGVLGVRARPAALDEPDAEVVEVPRDGQLVGDREVEPLLLGAVAQRRVVDVQAVDVAGGVSRLVSWSRSVLGSQGMVDVAVREAKNPSSGDESATRRKTQTRSAGNRARVLSHPVSVTHRPVAMRPRRGGRAITGPGPVPGIAR